MRQSGNPGTSCVESYGQLYRYINWGQNKPRRGRHPVDTGGAFIVSDRGCGGSRWWAEASDSSYSRVASGVLVGCFLNRMYLGLSISFSVGSNRSSMEFFFRQKGSRTSPNEQFEGYPAVIAS